MSRSAAVALLASCLSAAGCSETALVLEISSSELSAPADIDAVCLSVSALDVTGDDGSFARHYPITSLPQTLTVLSGGHGDVQVWVRALRGGLEVARAGVRTGFTDGSVDTVALEPRRCPAAGGGTPAVAGMDSLGGARVVVALGWRRPILIAIAPGQARAFVGDGGGLAAGSALPAAPGAVDALIAADLDGDCDEDLVIAAPGAAPIVWRHDGDGGFLPIDGAVPGGQAVALAAADVDGDGDTDLAAGEGGLLTLLRNDGSGRFQEDTGAFPAGSATDVTALAFGDVSGDGHPDLIVGQGSGGDAPNVLLVNDAAGQGVFQPSSALPALPGRTRALAVGDADADGDVDLIVARAGGAVKLYVNRGDGRLEDRSFVRLPATAAMEAGSVALGDLDGDCLPDLVVGAGGAVRFWRGTDGGAFVDGTLGADGDQVTIGDLDGDGQRDVIAASAGGLTWLAAP